MNTETITTTITIDNVPGYGEADLFELPLEVEYDVDGVDSPGSWWEPPERAAWIATAVRMTQEGLDAYNEGADEYGFPRLPWQAGHDILPLLTRKQREQVEDLVEREARHQAACEEGDYLADQYEDERYR